MVVIVCGVAYHLAQRGAGATSPWPMLAVAYAAALALSLALGFARGPSRFGQATRGECITGLLIGLAAFGVEAGFYYVYRAGWPLASASVIASLVSTAILALVGITVLGEHLSASRGAGIVLAGLAAVLIARG
jgi:drug/metabolite transporter (DMT)-like permease